MPSRKKAQGRARKTEKAKQASEKLRASCRHIALSEYLAQDESRDKYSTCSYRLFYEYQSLLSSWKRVHNGMIQQSELFQTTEAIYDKYHLFNDAEKQRFQELIIQHGTKACVEANILNSTKLEIPATIPLVALLQMIEIRDKHFGAINPNITLAISNLLRDTVHCPRETVKFFHRRNCCDCLQEIYYKLKETTERTSICTNCQRSMHIREMCRCECKTRGYCSRDCALEDWPEHKEACKSWVELTKMESSEATEEVD
jgi:hypothetical protein